MEKKDFTKELIETANAIGTPGKGILAADESAGTIQKKFKTIGVENTAENRRRYRQLLFSSEGIQQYISGVIFHEQTAKQSTQDGKKFISYLAQKGILSGIKVDKGVANIFGLKDQSYTKGLDALPAMAKEFYGLGCRFAKWRAVLRIGEGQPTELAISQNAWGLARYASICQQNGLVPIVQPEILSDGSHSVEQCQRITEKVLSTVFKALNENGVLLEGCLLKPNMVTFGSEHPKRKEDNIIQQAHRTVKALSRTVPPALAGVCFLSGGQSQQQASLHLSAMNSITSIRRPWFLTFSYGRALQNSAIKAWGGKQQNVKAAQQAFLVRAKANSEATLGKYVGSSDVNANKSLYEKDYKY